MSKWTAKEVKVLKDNYRKGPEVCKKLLKRSFDSIESKAIRLKLFIGRTCKNCSNSFILKESGLREYCSEDCKLASKQDRQRKRYRVVQGKPKRPDKNCLVCGTLFSPRQTGVIQKFCSKECREDLNNKLEKGRRSIYKKVGQDVSIVINQPISIDSNIYSDILSRRWEVLWRYRPDLHGIMHEIEKKLPIGVTK